MSTPGTSVQRRAWIGHSTPSTAGMHTGQRQTHAQKRTDRLTGLRREQCRQNPAVRSQCLVTFAGGRGVVMERESAGSWVLIMLPSLVWVARVGPVGEPRELTAMRALVLTYVKLQRTSKNQHEVHNTGAPCGPLRSPPRAPGTRGFAVSPGDPAGSRRAAELQSRRSRAAPPKRLWEGKSRGPLEKMQVLLPQGWAGPRALHSCLARISSQPRPMPPTREQRGCTAICASPSGSLETRI